jgi:epoxyqueuosine reductase QueG
MIKQIRGDSMDKSALIDEIVHYVDTSENNYVGENSALLRADLAGLRLFDEPLVGFADVNDVYFGRLKEDDVIGNHFMPPEEWNGEGKTVISIFFPFSQKIKKSNKTDKDWPSMEWLHGRIEGQKFVNEACEYVKSYLEKNGYKTTAPCIDKRFSAKNPVTTEVTSEKYYTSNWSERHIAYICGLGTFGLSKGLITSKGIAGRFGSLITGGYFEPDKRRYTGVYEYCNLCGRCIKNCPAHAISREGGKKHTLCSAFLETTKKKYRPWYGCGKCQINVSCENGIPKG